MENQNRHRKWKCALFTLCVVGLLQGFIRFSTRALLLFNYAGVEPITNFTWNQMVNDVLPSLIPSLVIILFILSIVTDALNYKPIIVVGAIGSVASWVIILWFYDIVPMAQLHSWFLNGLTMASTEVAYFTYAYAILDKSDYSRVTSYTHAALYTGQFLSGVLHQVLSTNKFITFRQLNYVCFGVTIVALVISALLLPKVLDWVAPRPENGGVYTINGTVQPKKNQVTYSNPTSKDDDENKVRHQAPSDAWYLKFRNDYGNQRQKPFLQKMKEAPSQTKKNFLHAFRNRQVLKWSLWYGFQFGLFLQLDTTFIFEKISNQISISDGETKSTVFNMGGVHAVHSLLSLVLGLCVGFRWGTAIWKKCNSYVLLGGASAIQGIALLVMSQTGHLYVAYGSYVLFVTVFQVMIIMSKSTVAESIRERSHGFIFGLNAVLASLIFAVLNLIISGGLQLGVRGQTAFLGVYALLVGVTGLSAYGFMKWSKNSNSFPCFK